MKKTKSIPIVVSSLLLILVVFLLLTWKQVKIKKEKFEEAKSTILHNQYHILYDQSFIDYFLEHFEFPSDLNEIIEYEANVRNTKKINKVYQDPFAEGKNSYLEYIPLYNRDNLKREGYLLYSSGIDGQIDYKYDSLFLDNFSNRMKFYNTINESNCKYVIDSNMKFDPLTSIFGDRDYLIGFMNGNNFMKIQVHFNDTLGINEMFFTIDSLLQTSNPDDLLRKKRFYLFEGEVKSKGNSVIHLSNDARVIHCDLYNPKLARNLKVGDNIIMIGLLKEIDLKNGQLYFYNCIRQSPLECAY